MISKEEVLKLATLARLKVEGAEVEALQKDISNILDYVGQVAAVKGDSSALAEVSPLTLHNVMREDEPRGEGDPLYGKEATVRAAFPKQEGGYNVVRKIIQKDEPR